MTELQEAEDKGSIPIDPTVYDSDPLKKQRSVKLYAVLGSYLKNRPLKVLRNVTTSDGYEVWRKLHRELEPNSRSRSLAMAQALVGFPAMSKGASFMDYVLTFEKLVNEYERLSGVKYGQNLMIGTIMKGIPPELRRHLMVDMSDKTTYQEMRARLLQYEQSSQTWSEYTVIVGSGEFAANEQALELSGTDPYAD